MTWAPKAQVAAFFYCHAPYLYTRNLMRRDLTDIVLVVDRSGSMEARKSDAEGGINSFIDEQKKLAGEARLTLVQFDTEYDFIHRAVPIKDIPRFLLFPRGGTALLDAVGRAINETGERLRAMAEADRPGLVVFVIVTDGQENSSHEFDRARIKSMIEHQQNVYKWQFTYIGESPTTFADAANIGISHTHTLNFAPTAHGHRHAYKAATSNVARMRGEVLTSGSLSFNANHYTQAEQEEAAK